jgi:glycerophosphoryl diester phosphodiesterase
MKSFSLFFFLILGLSQKTMGQTHFLNIGHRGAMGYELENTRASFLKAIELNVDMIELDVFRCASGEIVVFHDDNLKRLSDSEANIEDLSFDSIQKIKLNNGEQIPLLSEILDLIGGKLALNIELKGKNTAQSSLELVSKAILSGKWREDQFVISSFDWEELATVRKLNSTIQIAVLTDDKPFDAIKTAQNLKAIAINSWYPTLTLRCVKRIHSYGFRVFAFTVNDVKSIKRIKKITVDGIFCNFPDRVNN